MKDNKLEQQLRARLKEILEVVYEKGELGLDQKRTIFFNLENTVNLFHSHIKEIIGEDEEVVDPSKSNYAIIDAIIRNQLRAEQRKKAGLDE